MYRGEFKDIKAVFHDVKEEIRAKEQEMLTYDLPENCTLVVEVVDNASGYLEIAVEKHDENGMTLESATDDYDCADEVLWAMIENAVY